MMNDRQEWPAMGRTMDALSIILSSPIWPKRESLPECALGLYERMLVDARPIARFVADSEYEPAMKAIAEWGGHVHEIYNKQKVKGNEPLEGLLAVFCHYTESVYGRNTLKALTE